MRFVSCCKSRASLAGHIDGTRRTGTLESPVLLNDDRAILEHQHRRTSPRARRLRAGYNMNWGILTVLSNAWFVVPWYVVGITAAFWVAYDVLTTNTALKTAMKWAWPIIVLFFSVIGVALYYFTARAPGVGSADSEQRKSRAHDEFERIMFRRVNGAVIHCVAGDGLGIMSAMVIARATGMSFWQEFWFEYAVGFAFGLFIFQLLSMRAMADGILPALAMAFRAEFFSMLTVMGGMGAVMAFVTPSVVGSQPHPLTYAFWGFGMIGLLVGYVFTFPMNWMLVAIGWKHGMGNPEGARTVGTDRARAWLFAAMTVLGAIALTLPAWLNELREDRRHPAPHIVTADVDAMTSDGAAVESGLLRTLQVARQSLRDDDRTDAVTALDAAMRVAAIVRTASPAPHNDSVYRAIVRARRALQMGEPGEALRRIPSMRPGDVLLGARASGATSDFIGATVLDTRGIEIGELIGVRGNRIRLALGGARDVWGFLDLGADRIVTVPAGRLMFGADHILGGRYVIGPI